MKIKLCLIAIAVGLLGFTAVRIYLTPDTYCQGGLTYQRHADKSVSPVFGADNKLVWCEGGLPAVGLHPTIKE